MPIALHKWNNNIQKDNGKDINLVIPMYNSIKYSANSSKTFGSLWQYYRGEPALTNASAADNFQGNIASFKFKQKTTSSTGTADDTKKCENNFSIEVFK